MTTPPDPVTAAQVYLQGDLEIVAFVGGAELVTTRELTREDAEAMPRRQVLIAPAGGSTEAGRAELDHVRIDTKSYAETPFDASALDRLVLRRFRELDRNAVPGQSLLHDAIVETGGVPLREAAINDAPLMLRSYLVTASAVAVA